MTLENTFFKEVTLRICNTLDIQEALHHTFDYFKTIIPCDVLSLVYTDSAKKVMIPVARAEQNRSPFSDYKLNLEIPLYEEYDTHLEEIEAKENRSAIILNRPDKWRKEMIKVFPYIKEWSTLTLQLKIRGQRIGKLVASAKGLDRYTDSHASLMESIKEPVAIALSNARRYQELVQVKDLLAEDNRELSAELKRSSGMEVVGADFGLRDVMAKVRQVAPSNSPTLLLGETGTGKEVIANAIHTTSPRQKGPMITMQCGAIPETLLDSELFGHEKGAFTGAYERKRGKFERAHGGTLFLDEIGELSQEAQIKLLRVLQEKRIERIGGTKTIEVDVRVVAATHRDLNKMVREGTFREDLWYRINVFPIHIPPLRMRKEDIPSLVQYFIIRKVQEMNLAYTPHFDNDMLTKLKDYDFPGNVRELQNLVERALLLSRGKSLKFPELNKNPATNSSLGFKDQVIELIPMDDVISNHIRRVLNHVNDQIEGEKGAAKILQMNPATLRFRMKKLGIKRKVYR